MACRLALNQMNIHYLIIDLYFISAVLPAANKITTANKYNIFRIALKNPSKTNPTPPSAQQQLISRSHSIHLCQTKRVAISSAKTWRCSISHCRLVRMYIFSTCCDCKTKEFRIDLKYLICARCLNERLGVRFARRRCSSAKQKKTI